MRGVTFNSYRVIVTSRSDADGSCARSEATRPVPQSIRTRATDVLAGWMIGGTWVVLVRRLARAASAPAK